ncbi:hypothetical protein MUB24_14360 [Lederbergia sp. NSJ-179]|nr:zinc finger domain-containing protein [Lederbergia sp. NSJ-179]MCJ7842064.1 hypothetical protein [Lederbergia sp. NSJ-179]
MSSRNTFYCPVCQK